MKLIKTTPKLSYIAGVFAVFLWALSPVLIKVSALIMPVSFFLFLRFSLSSLFLIGLTPSILQKRKLIPLSLWIMIAVTAAIHNGTQAHCLREIPISWYTLFFSTTPILTILFIPKECTKITLALLGLAFLGSFIFFNPTGITAYPSFPSIVTMFFCVVSWALLTILMIKIHAVYSDLETTYILNYSNLLSAIFLLLWTHTPIYLPSFEVIKPILILSMLSPIAMYLFSYSVRHTPTFGIAAQYLEIVFGMMIGYYFFSEIPTFFQLIGGSLIVAALIGKTIIDIKNHKNIPIEIE